MSRYLADLNKISPTEPAPMTDFDDEFLNAFADDFVDLDTIGDPFTGLSADFDLQRSTKNADSMATNSAQPSPDFLDNNFDFSDFSTYPAVLDTSLDDLDAQPTPYPFIGRALMTAGMPAVAPPMSPTSPATARAGEKRKQPDATDPKLVVEETARVAAEEDKRRRNTAASARFRIKKKQREQTLEKTAKDMADRATTLETKVQQLEMENKWLKSLITEKNEGKSDLQELYEKYARDHASSSTGSIGVQERKLGAAIGKKRIKAEKQ